MSAAPTFSDALDQAELLARQHLPVSQHTRIACAVALVKGGGVLQRDDGSWDVTSQSEPGRQYHLNEAGCGCEDAHYRAPQGQCKHVLATLLARKTVKLMRVPEPMPVPVKPDAIEPYPDNDPGPPPPCPGTPLPEAPASANCYVMIEGRQVQLTLRDTDEQRLLARLATVLKQYPAPSAPAKVPKGQAQPQGEKGWCAIHNVSMKETTKEGRSWYSHRTDQGWCKGR
jgi:hypothetical protein